MAQDGHNFALIRREAPIDFFYSFHVNSLGGVEMELGDDSEMAPKVLLLFPLLGKKAKEGEKYFKRKMS